MNDETPNTPSKVRKAFYSTLDKALVETVKDILGAGADADTLTSESNWKSALEQVQSVLKKRIDVRNASANGLDWKDGKMETEVLRYEIWVDDAPFREVVMTTEMGGEPFKFHIKTRLI